MLIVSAKDVENELLKSKDEINRINQANNHFHGNIDRNSAEKLLRDAYSSGGGILLNLKLFKLCSN
jgi:hypothetical protein